MNMTSSSPKKLLAALLLSTGLLGATGCATPANRPATNDTVLMTSDKEPLVNRSEVVALVASVDSATDLEQTAAHWGYELKRKEKLAGLGLYMLTFDCPPGIDPEVATQELERLSPRAEVEVNHRFSLSSSSQSSSSSSIASIQLGLPVRSYAHQLMQWPDEGCDVPHRLGMIDGAVQRSALPTDQVVEMRSFTKRDSETAKAHGTAIAQLLVGEGRLRGANLYAASVIETDRSGDDYSGVEPILRALDWMVRNDVGFINISLAGPRNAALTEGFNRALDKGVVIVAAVGNDGPGARPRYPAALDGVVAATAIDANLSIYPRAVRGDHVDVSAPGVEVYVPDVDGGRYLSGTSMAAPFVTAALAAASLSGPNQTVNDMSKRLPDMTVDLGEDGRDPIFGEGLIRAVSRCR